MPRTCQLAIYTSPSIFPFILGITYSVITLYLLWLYLILPDFIYTFRSHDSHSDKTFPLLKLKIDYFNFDPNVDVPYFCLTPFLTPLLQTSFMEGPNSFVLWLWYVLTSYVFLAAQWLFSTM